MAFIRKQKLSDEKVKPDELSCSSHRMRSDIHLVLQEIKEDRPESGSMTFLKYL